MISADMEPLLFLCLLTLSGLTFGDQSGTSSRVTVMEDDDAILPCSIGSNTNIESDIFHWKKEGTNPRKEVFFYKNGRHSNDGQTGQDEQFKDRVSHFPEELKHGNASIKITKVTLHDKGKYICIFPNTQSGDKSIELVVVGELKDRTRDNIPGAAPKPSITTLDETKDWALLQCEVLGAYPQPEVVWKDSSNNTVSSEEPKVSERGGRFYITLQTTVTKTDHYRCVATQEEMGHQIYTETYEHLNGAASKPSVKILKETMDWALLQCDVQGASPKPEVVWKDSSGNILPAEEPQVTEKGGSYDIILQTTVTKTDYYRCEATQEEINHQTDSETYVHLSVSESPTGWIIAAVIFGVLFVAGVVLLLVLKAKGYSCNKGSLTETSLSTSMQQRDHTSKEPLKV